MLMALCFPSVHLVRKCMNEKLNNAIKQYKILYNYAFAGWGKTTSILSWLKETGISHTYVSADGHDNLLDLCGKIQCLKKRSLHILVIDDYHSFTDERAKKELADYMIKSKNNIKFIILSRSEPAQELKQFMIRGQMCTLNHTDLKYSEDEAVTLMKNNGVELQPKQVQFVIKQFEGYPILYSALINRFRENQNRFSSKIYDICKRDIFDYFDMTVTKCWGKSLLRFAALLADLDEITPEIAKSITNEDKSEEVLESLLLSGSFLQFEPPNKYLFCHCFREYLKQKQRKVLTKEEQKSMHHSLGMHYEMVGMRLIKALRHYLLAEDMGKINHLLSANLIYEIERGSYEELEEMLSALSREQILSNPRLCSIVSMLHSLCCRIYESEYWYGKLIEMKNILSKETSEYQILEDQIFYLSSALPHVDIKGGMSRFMNVVTYDENRIYGLTELTFTESQPSILHGSKDFCELSNSFETIHEFLEKVLLTIYGNTTVGVYDLLVGELYYEQGRLDDAMVALLKGCVESRTRGDVNILFAGVCALVRLFMAKGMNREAFEKLYSIQSRIPKNPRSNLKINYECMIIQLKLYTGDYEEVNEWLEKESPDENKSFYLMDCFGYLIKARIYILKEEYENAEILLERIRRYAKEYRRTYIYMEATLLEAILLYQKGEKKWYYLLNEVITFAQSYHFTRILINEGNAVFPLLKSILNENKIKNNETFNFIQNIYKECIQFSNLYPKYFKWPQSEKDNKLTEKELQVLNLLMEGKKYCEIEQELKVSMNTVKFHVKNIYGKLDISSRNELMIKAKELRIYHDRTRN